MHLLEFLWRYIIFGTFESVTLLFLFLYLIDDLKFLWVHWKSCLLYIVLYVLMRYILLYQLEVNYTVLYFVFSVLVLAYITKTDLYFSLTANIVSFLVYAISEIVVSIPVLYLMGTSINSAKQDISLMRNVLLVVRPIQMVILYLITRLPIKKEILKKKSNREDGSSINYILLMLFFMSIFFAYLAEYVENTTVLIASGLLFISAVGLGVIEVKGHIKLIDIKGQLKLQEEYARNMELIVDAVRKEKHDYKNHISTLVALCTIQDIESMGKIRNYALKLTNNEFESGLHFYNTGNKYLDGLLAIKRDTAVNKDIYFDVDVEATLDNIQVDDVDLTNIVGNIVDNAFDAVGTNPPEKNKIVSLAFYEENDKLQIAISNNGSEITEQHKKRIFEYKYSTKNKAVGERGYGLFIVKELIQKNNGEINFYSNEVETEFLISFKKVPKSKGSIFKVTSTFLK